MKFVQRGIMLFTLLLACGVSLAQQSGAIQTVGPLTRDLGALSTLSAQTAATVNSSDQSGFNVSRIACVFRETSTTGAPSTTFSIQNKDVVSGVYYNLITSSAVTATPTATTVIYAGAGVTTTANVSAGLPIASKWRVSATVAGSSTPTVWGTIGCSVQ